MALNELRSADSAHAFAFASDYLGKRVTAGGRTVGRLTDLVAAREGLYPVVTGAVVRSADGERFLPVRHLATLGEGDIDPAALSDFRLGENQFLVRDVLLDKQIVDMEGAKVVRVNDVHMLFAQGKTYVVHVDVGLSGLLRRLGFEGGARRMARLVGRPMKDEFISWRHVQTLEGGRERGQLKLVVARPAIDDLHPGELAEILEDLNKDDRVALMHTVDTETAANALEEVEPELGAAIVGDLDPHVAADIMEEMEASAAADIFEELPEDHQSVIMQRMEPDEREEIELLRTFGERTAGALMSTDFVTAAEDATAADALRLVREHAEDVEMLHYVFCHDGAGRLTGVVSLKALVLAPPETVLKDLFGGRLVFAKPDDGIAAVAEQFYKYNFLALPVVGEAEKLLGIITFKHSFDELVPYYHRQAA